MALSSTMYNVAVDLSDVDRGVYETLDLRLAKHPSESPEYLATRLLAYCLESTDGIEFTAGLSNGDEPAILVRDLTGLSQPLWRTSRGSLRLGDRHRSLLGSLL